jgi:hypothetical protein
MTTSQLPPEFRAHVLERDRAARQAANAFLRICKEGSADQIETAALWLDETVGGWRRAMAKVGKLGRVTPEVQNAFETEWIARKHLSLLVGNRPACAAALRVLLPGGYSGPPLTLYRGTHQGERRRRLYGFSWTTDAAIARQFAQPHAENALEGRAGIVLQTLAPPQAILLIRQQEGASYDENEVVVDPYRLAKIVVHERLQ